MDDREIVDLYWDRAESAIAETQAKYGNYCRTVAYNILRSEEDAEECVNDVYVRAWESIPPNRPTRLCAFLGRITRNLALDRYRSDGTQKRGAGQVELVLDELTECVADPTSPDSTADGVILKDALERFLRSLPVQTMKVFMRRYFYMSSVAEIAKEYGLSESRVKVTLFRARKKLKEFLEKEGIEL